MSLTPGFRPALVESTTSASIVYFFFQAEDGIRDRNVTGVQTCALPIFRKVTGAAALWSHSRKQIGSYGDVAIRGELIGDAAHPVCEPEYLMDHDNGRRFVDRKSVV